MGDHTDILVFVFQNRPLLDMQFKERMHFTRTDVFVAQVTDTRQLITELQATGIFTVIGPIQSVYAGKYPGCNHGRCKAGAFFIGPVGNNDRVFCLDVQIVQLSNNFKPTQYAKHTVVFTASGLRIKMTTDIHGQGVRVGAFATSEHGAHFVQSHGAAGFFTPPLK